MSADRSRSIHLATAYGYGLLYIVFISKEDSLTCIVFVVILVSTAIGCGQIGRPGNGQCSSNIPVAVVRCLPELEAKQKQG